MPTDWGKLLPVNVAREVIASATQQSAVLSLARVQRMPTGVEQIPVVSALPTAGWVEAEPASPSPTWSGAPRPSLPKRSRASSPCPTCISPTRPAAGTSEQSVEQELAGAAARLLDAAVLFGRNAPATFPPGGVAGAAAPLTGSDALDAIDKGMSAVEASGLTPNGVAADSTIGGALRAAYREVRALPSETPEPTVYGLPVRVVSPWTAPVTRSSATGRAARRDPRGHRLHGVARRDAARRERRDRRLGVPGRHDARAFDVPRRLRDRQARRGGRLRHEPVRERGVEQRSRNQRRRRSTTGDADA